MEVAEVADTIRSAILMLCGTKSLPEPWTLLTDQEVIKEWKKQDMPFVDPIIQVVEEKYDIKDYSKTIDPTVQNFYMYLNRLSDERAERQSVREDKVNVSIRKFHIEIEK